MHRYVQYSSTRDQTIVPLSPLFPLIIVYCIMYMYEYVERFCTVWRRQHYQGWASVLFKRTRVLAFFCVLYKKNVVFFAFFYVLYKRMLRYLRSFMFLI